MDPADLSVAMPPDFGETVTLMGDVSEFQPDIADPVYVRDFSQAIIIRAMFGDQHDDGAWYGGARRDALHAAGVQFLGIYQYIVAGQDAIAQADALGNLLGSLRPGEKIIADMEEGAGYQQGRWEVWANRVGQLGNDPWNYSGEYFAAAHGLAPVDWVAAYGVNEPSVQHQLWQFSDQYDIPGVGACDCSVYHGPVSELASAAFQVPAQSTWTYPKPANLVVARKSRSGYVLKWDAVWSPGGHTPSTYSVYTYDNTTPSQLVNHQDLVAGTQAAEYGPTGRGLPPGVYHTYVWANGAPSAPPHASVTVALSR